MPPVPRHPLSFLDVLSNADSLTYFSNAGTSTAERALAECTPAVLHQHHSKLCKCLSNGLKLLRQEHALLSGGTPVLVIATLCKLVKTCWKSAHGQPMRLNLAKDASQQGLLHEIAATSSDMANRLKQQQQPASTASSELLQLVLGLAGNIILLWPGKLLLNKAAALMVVAVAQLLVQLMQSRQAEATTTAATATATAEAAAAGSCREHSAAGSGSVSLQTQPTWLGYELINLGSCIAAGLVALSKTTPPYAASALQVLDSTDVHHFMLMYTGASTIWLYAYLLRQATLAPAQQNASTSTSISTSSTSSTSSSNTITAGQQPHQQQHRVLAPYAEQLLLASGVCEQYVQMICEQAYRGQGGSPHLGTASEALLPIALLFDGAGDALHLQDACVQPLLLCVADLLFRTKPDSYSTVLGLAVIARLSNWLPDLYKEADGEQAATVAANPCPSTVVQPTPVAATAAAAAPAPAAGLVPFDAYLRLVLLQLGPLLLQMLDRQQLDKEDAKQCMYFYGIALHQVLFLAGRTCLKNYLRDTFGEQPAMCSRAIEAGLRGLMQQDVVAGSCKGAPSLKVLITASHLPIAWLSFQAKRLSGGGRTAGQAAYAEQQQQQQVFALAVTLLKLTATVIGCWYDVSVMPAAIAGHLVKTYDSSSSNSNSSSSSSSSNSSSSPSLLLRVVLVARSVEALGRFAATKLHSRADEAGDGAAAADDDTVAAIYMHSLLDACLGSVTWLVSQLQQLQQVGMQQMGLPLLPENVLLQLQQQQVQLTAQVNQAVQVLANVAAAAADTGGNNNSNNSGNSSSSSSPAAGVGTSHNYNQAVVLDIHSINRVFNPRLRQQLQQFGAAVCALLPLPYCCNNPACTNIAKASELQLVGGKACLCGGCRTARFCSRACQEQCWPAHKAVCKRIKAQQATATTAMEAAAVS